MAKKETKNPKTEAKEEKKQKAATEAAPEAEETKAADDCEKKLLELNDKYLRTLAEYENYRKRSTKEKEDAWANSKANVLAELLPVLDNFDRALSNKEASLEDYQRGVEMIYNQFMETIKKLGVESFGEPGDSFDPNIHNAVMHADDENEPENSITDVFSKGYKLGDKILRPAVVKVVN